MGAGEGGIEPQCMLLIREPPQSKNLIPPSRYAQRGVSRITLRGLISDVTASRIQLLSASTAPRKRPEARQHVNECQSYGDWQPTSALSPTAQVQPIPCPRRLVSYP